MPKYERQYEEEIETNDDTTPVVTPVLDKEEENWKKRYGDLRRHADSLKNTIDELKNSTTEQKEVAPPADKASVEAWLAKYPAVGNIVKSIVLEEVGKVRKEVETSRSETRKEKQDRIKEEAKAALAEEHPDFFDEILPSNDFKEWIMQQSKARQDALFINETDVQAASEVLDAYKIYRDRIAAHKNTRDTASDVTVRGTPSVGTTTGKIFKESWIDSLKSSEFEKYEDEIDKARAEGRIEYDLTGGAY